jgi:hypothetical protein
MLNRLSGILIPYGLLAATGGQIFLYDFVLFCLCKKNLRPLDPKIDLLFSSIFFWFCVNLFQDKTIPRYKSPRGAETAKLPPSPAIVGYTMLCLVVI